MSEYSTRRRLSEKLRLNSLYGRLFLVILVMVLTAFAVSNTVWIRYLDSKKTEQVENMARDMAYNMASTVVFFRNFPEEFRPQILQLLRDMGGARFFVSINKNLIDVTPIASSQLSTAVHNAFTEAMNSRLGDNFSLEVSIADPRDLRVFTDDIRLIDLPDRWAQNVIILNPEPAPLLVAQFQVANGEWLYLAGLFPEPFILNSQNQVSEDQLIFVIFVTIFMLLGAWFMVRWLTRPLLLLSRAAQSLGKEMHHVTIEEKGSFEVRQTAHAFNMMQNRLLRFIEDREHLFSAISHDLKTPITRLRLRAEFIEDDELKQGITHDLDDLENLVRGALEFARGTDIHEANSAFNLVDLFLTFREDFSVLGHNLILQVPASLTFDGKPLALRRCFTNLIENAFFYGRICKVRIFSEPGMVIIYISDDGPGIDEKDHQRVFEPFVRLEGSRNRNTGGSGLGLSIARNIVHAHGGQMTLDRSEMGGLKVIIQLPTH